jgi:hypothetical protein
MQECGAVEMKGRAGPGKRMGSRQMNAQTGGWTAIQPSLINSGDQTKPTLQKVGILCLLIINIRDGHPGDAAGFFPHMAVLSSFSGYGSPDRILIFLG